MKEEHILYVVMELGNYDLSFVIKREIQRYGCVKEPSRSFFWLKMLEAVKVIHDKGLILFALFLKTK